MCGSGMDEGNAGGPPPFFRNSPFSSDGGRPELFTLTYRPNARLSFQNRISRLGFPRLCLLSELQDEAALFTLAAKTQMSLFFYY